MEPNSVVTGPDESLTSIAEAEGSNFEEELICAEGKGDGTVQSEDVDWAEGSKEVLGYWRRSIRGTNCTLKHSGITTITQTESYSRHVLGYCRLHKMCIK
jgi:hypothetical protein